MNTLMQDESDFKSQKRGQWLSGRPLSPPHYQMLERSYDQANYMLDDFIFDIGDPFDINTSNQIPGSPLLHTDKVQGEMSADFSKSDNQKQNDFNTPVQNQKEGHGSVHDSSFGSLEDFGDPLFPEQVSQQPSKELLEQGEEVIVPKDPLPTKEGLSSSPKASDLEEEDELFQGIPNQVIERTRRQYQEEQERSKVNIIDPFSLDSLRKHYEETNLKNLQKYNQALKAVEMKGESLHNKVFDLKSGKFRQVTSIDNVLKRKKINQKFYLEKGNILGRMDAEIDLFMRDNQRPVNDGALRHKSKLKTQKDYLSSDMASLRAKEGFFASKSYQNSTLGSETSHLTNQQKQTSQETFEKALTPLKDSTKPVLKPSLLQDAKTNPLQELVSGQKQKPQIVVLTEFEQGPSKEDFIDEFLSQRKQNKISLARKQLTSKKIDDQEIQQVLSGMEIRKGPEVKASPLKKRDAKLKAKENAEILKDKSSRISDGGDCKSNRQLQEPPCAVTDCVPISKRQKVTPTDQVQNGTKLSDQDGDFQIQISMDNENDSYRTLKPQPLLAQQVETCDPFSTKARSNAARQLQQLLLEDDENVNALQEQTSKNNLINNKHSNDSDVLQSKQHPQRPNLDQREFSSTIEGDYQPVGEAKSRDGEVDVFRRADAHQMQSELAKASNRVHAAQLQARQEETIQAFTRTRSNLTAHNKESAKPENFKITLNLGQPKLASVSKPLQARMVNPEGKNQSPQKKSKQCPLISNMSEESTAIVLISSDSDDAFDCVSSEEKNQKTVKASLPKVSDKKRPQQGQLLERLSGSQQSKQMEIHSQSSAEKPVEAVRDFYDQLLKTIKPAELDFKLCLPQNDMQRVRQFLQQECNSMGKLEVVPLYIGNGFVVEAVLDFQLFKYQVLMKKVLSIDLDDIDNEDTSSHGQLQVSKPSHVRGPCIQQSEWSKSTGPSQSQRRSSLEQQHVKDTSQIFPGVTGKDGNPRENSWKAAKPRLLL